MKPIYVDGEPINFPDDMSDEEILQVLRQKFPPQQQEAQPVDYGLRLNGTKKGRGYLGEIKRPDGTVMTEYSVGVNFDGQEQDIPTLVPTLTTQEIELLKNLNQGDKIPTSILDKAVVHAIKRREQGKSPFFTDNESVDFDLGTAVGNIPESAENYVGNIAGAVTHPVDTLQNLDSLAMSGIANMMGNEDPEMLAPGQQFAEYVKGRFGSMDAFKQSLMDDPVGVAADLAGILQGGGAALGMLPKTAPMAAAVGRGIQTAGNIIDPLAIVNRGVKGLSQAAMNVPGLKHIPEDIYQKAAQFKDVDVMKEALKRGINPADALESLNKQRRAVGADIGDVVNSSNQASPADALLQGMDARRASLVQPGVNATQELRGFDRFVEDMKAQLGLDQQAQSRTSPILDPSGRGMTVVENTPAPDLSPIELQRFKTDAWKRLYGDRKRVPEDYSGRALKGGEQAKLQAASNAKGLLEGIFGDRYKYANKEYGTLSDLIKEVEPASKRIARAEEALATNATRFGTKSTLLGMALGRPDIGIAGAGSGLLGNIIRSPTRRIKTAITLKNARDHGLMDYINPQREMAGPVMSFLDELERQRQRELKKKLRR